MAKRNKDQGRPIPQPKACIMLADDDPDILSLLDVTLSQAGYAIKTARDGAEAISLLPNGAIQVAIVDISMPGMSGLDLCRTLWEQHGIEVILLTGHSERYSYTDAVRSGAYDFVVKPPDMAELILRVERALEARRVRIERDRTLKELQRLSTTDSTTGLFNSRHLFQRLKSELARSHRHGHPLSLLLLDIDDFKGHNDSHGHQAGDEALRYLADVLRRVSRESDSAYRYGGDEFTIILPETNAASSLILAERLLEEVSTSELPTPGGDVATLTVSVGIAQWCKGEDMHALLKRADLAMYESKASGRNRASVAEPPDPEDLEAAEP